MCIISKAYKKNRNIFLIVFFSIIIFSLSIFYFFSVLFSFRRYQNLSEEEKGKAKRPKKQIKIKLKKKKKKSVIRIFLRNKGNS